jgi:hypothetical protein
MTKPITGTAAANKTIFKSKVNFSGNALNKVSLSSADAKDITKVTNLMVDVIRRQRRLWRKEIDDLTAARYAKYNAEIPRNWMMQELYEDVMMDGHLTGITENRTLRTTNKTYVFTIDGKTDDKLTEFIKDKEWFEFAKSEAHNSTYVGENVIWITDYAKGEIKGIDIIPRYLLCPEKKVILYDINATKGIDYSQIDDILLPARFYSVGGLLEKAAVYSWGSWDEFEELFGIPIRIAKIASQSETVKNEVAGWLEEMGSAPYAVFPIGTEVDIKENSKTDSFNVFYKKIEALDKEMSKLVLHQTMTTENGSSKAQGGVHENTLGELIKADEKKMLAFLNNKLVPAMRKLGYNIPENAKIGIETTKDTKAQIAVDGVLMQNGYVLKQTYLEQTYGVEIESMPTGEQKPEPAKKP